MRKNFALLILCVAGTLCFAAKLPKKMYVAVENAQLKDGTSFFAKSISDLKYASVVIPLEEKGKYLKVTDSLSNKTGWIASSALSKRKITASAFKATADEMALAGKGFTAEIENAYKKNNKADFKSVDFIESFPFDKTKFYDFLIEGKLNGVQQ